ncbi:unnamed protein product [Phyllotreta striolata]|uniref:Uncharacterized protein n=1 Tax=Phyllotreta striolata TaxID=444603 RepID=A0A9N9TQ16_PHYSR|nr:unnamed protein product [Phyllotreta striolata]
MLLKEQSEEITSQEELNLDEAIVAEIMVDYDKNRALIEAYRKSKTIQVETNPVLVSVENLLFNIIKPVLNEILYRIHCEDGFYRPRSSFNGLDYISEFFYNSNPRYPERKKNWTYIFDIDWVKEYLQTSPRPYYPISLLMTKNTAAKYIQAHVRGYWVRKRADLEEIRQFWKTIKLERDLNGRLSFTRTLDESL